MESSISFRARGAALSGATHLLLLLPLLTNHRPRLRSAAHPGDSRGSRITLTYSPGSSAQQASVAGHPATVKAKLSLKPVATLQAKLAASPSAIAISARDNSGGSDSAGSGNTTVALAIFFPWPRPDLSELSRGSRGDVIVEVTISENGRIVESRLTRGLGENIDRDVLATIQTWIFKPATKDGVAVPSEQELLFHYEHG